MTDKFLLYIDILGFTEMVRKEPRKIARIYSILDRLNVHRHPAFKSIVFSDTVLVYNIEPATDDDQRRYFVWYLTEFAEDLHHRLTGQDVYFRATLVAGDFSHYHLNHVECFYGTALISAYLGEKDIPSVGLFMARECEQYNQFFRLAPFNDEFSFVYLNRALEQLNQHVAGSFPVDDFEMQIGDIAPYITWQVRFLKDIHHHMRKHSEPRVRSKFLTAWDMHKRRYPRMLEVLESNSFSACSLGLAPDWAELESRMLLSVRYFKRIGSGTALSKSITGSRSVTGSKKSKRSR
jgi:hypothetical protein